MKIGPLRQRVTIQAATETRDAYGQKHPVWTDGGSYWAEVRNLSGREAVNARQIVAEATHVVRMRYVGALFPTGGVLSSMRMIFKGVTFNLLWINNVDNRQKTYEILAQELPGATS